MNSAGWFFRVPWALPLIAVALVLCGWQGIARTEVLAGGEGRMLARQMLWSAVALAAMVLAVLPDYRVLCRRSYPLFGLGLLLLVAVYFFPRVNGAHRWIRLGPVGLQPSEFAKVLFVLALARYLMHRENFRRPAGLLAPLLLAMIPVVLILREPDLGTSLVFVPVLLAMLFTAGARRRDLALVVFTGLCLVPLLWTQMSREQRSRVTAVLSQTGPGETPSGDTYHLHQAKQMLALGGVWGSVWSGPVVDDLSVYHVPEGATDSVFVVLAERFGLAGVAVLLALYLALVWRVLAVAAATREPYGRLVATGVAALFAVEAIINTGMMVGLLPITGLSLPLVSYGGSGLLAHCLALGLVMNIAVRPGYEVAAEPFRWAKEERRAA
jgi:cell division protein FtsW (lipid II flippase)